MDADEVRPAAAAGHRPGGQPESSRRGRPRAADRQRRRDALLESALRVFLTNGYGATSLDLVAAEAGVAKRTIYTSVGDKADLFVAVVRRLGDRAVAPLAEGRPASVTALAPFATRLVTMMLSDEAVGLHRLVIGEASNFPDLAHRLYANGPRRYRVLLAELLAVVPAARLRVPADQLDEAAEALFTQLLGERHRRRLFCLAPAPSAVEVKQHVARTLGLFVDPTPGRVGVRRPR